MAHHQFLSITLAQKKAHKNAWRSDILIKIMRNINPIKNYKGILLSIWGEKPSKTSEVQENLDVFRSHMAEYFATALIIVLTPLGDAVYF